MNRNDIFTAGDGNEIHNNRRSTMGENGKDREQRILSELAQEEKKGYKESLKHILEWNKTPKQIKEELDNYIIGQDRGKKVISTEIYFHYLRLGSALKHEIETNGGDIDRALATVKTPKANIIFVGPSGCGKTYTAEKVSSIVSVPFVKEDMTKFSETGYVGRDLSEIVTDLMQNAEGNHYLAQMGIVFLDEIDKIYGANTVGRDVSGKGVQNGLLKLVEGSETNINSPEGNKKVSTNNVLFIASGAFEGLEDHVRHRLARTGTEMPADKTWRDYVINDDFINYGMERQLLGRFPVKAFYDQLKEPELVSIMQDSKDSPLSAYKADLALAGIELEVKDDALSEIAKKAIGEKTGARGLIGVIFDVLLPERYELAGSYKGKVTLTKEMVQERLSKYQKGE